MVFGGDFLMAQTAETLRTFFDAFFRLPETLWTVSVGYPREQVSVPSRPCPISLILATFLRPVTLQGFLAGWPGLPNNEYHSTWDNRFNFGIRLWFLAPLSLKFALAKSGVLTGGFSLIRSVTPLADLYEEEGTTEVEGAEAWEGSVKVRAATGPTNTTRGWFLR